MLNSKTCERQIVVSCMNTDLNNEHIAPLIKYLSGIILGIGLGKLLAMWLGLESPDIPLAVTAAMVAAGLVFCIQQILMQPVAIIFSIEDEDRLELHTGNCNHKANMFWRCQSETGVDMNIDSIFDGSISVTSECGPGEMYRKFLLSGKPSKELIQVVLDYQKSNSKDLLYSFKTVSIVLTPKSARTEEELNQFLTKNLQVSANSKA